MPGAPRSRARRARAARAARRRRRRREAGGGAAADAAADARAARAFWATAGLGLVAIERAAALLLRGGALSWAARHVPCLGDPCP